MTNRDRSAAAGTRSPSRRSFLQLAGAGAAVAVGGSVGASSAASQATPPAPVAPSAGPATPVPATGPHQAGVGRPATPQPHQVLAVFDLDRPALAATVLATVGRRILDVTSGRSGAMLGLAPGDVTITVGVGPRLVSVVDTSLPGAQALPEFAREQITEQNRGGDVLVQACASDPVVASVALEAVTDGIGALTSRWRETAARGAGVSLPDGRHASRNVMGFVDGIVAPSGSPDAAAEVWIAAPAAVRGASIAVVRRMEIDIASFAAKSLAQQEAVLGRHRESGTPLSGGSIIDPPALGAVTADGRYLVPLHSHVRRAHSTATGVPQMLRRSYSMSAPAGLLFVSYQNDLNTFVATLNRMQDGDDLFDLTTTTATGSFLVLPGFDESRPLGATLFD